MHMLVGGISAEKTNGHLGGLHDTRGTSEQASKLRRGHWIRHALVVVAVLVVRPRAWAEQRIISGGGGRYRGDGVSRNGTAGLARGGTKSGLLGNTGGGFLSGSLAFFLFTLAKETGSSRRDTGESGAGGRGAGGHVLMVKNPVGLRGDAPIAIPHSGNVGKSLPRVSMNTIMFSDPHTLDPLGVKHLQKLGL
jgi:hypothetical protein